MTKAREMDEVAHLQAIEEIVARAVERSKKQQLTGMSFSEMFAHYMQKYAKQHCKRWREFERSFELYLLPLAHKDMAEIKKPDILTLQSELVESRSRSAANRAVELISMVYNKAIEWDMYDGSNPAARVRKFRFQPRERFLQPDEIRRFLEQVNKLRYETTRDFYWMLLLTAQRRHDVSSMRWQDLRLSRCIWYIPETKNGTAHNVPLVDEAVEILMRRHSNPDRHPIWVFPKRDGSGHIWDRYTSWLALLERAGLNDLRMHDLRRSLASWQAITGANISVIARTLNHKDLKSTQIYARLNLDPVHDAMQKAVKTMLEQPLTPVAVSPPNTELSGEDWLSEEDAAALLGISLHTLKIMRYKRFSPPFEKVGYQSTVYRKSDLLAWKEAKNFQPRRSRRSKQ